MIAEVVHNGRILGKGTLLWIRETAGPQTVLLAEWLARHILSIFCRHGLDKILSVNRTGLTVFLLQEYFAVFFGLPDQS